MRLINTMSLKMSEMVDRHQPEYAILSHRWEDREVSFAEFQQRDYGSFRNFKGYLKIRQFCELARSKGFRWAWVDTCCIDKSSSSELSEAINSMYAWYRASSLCCVFLSDVRNKDELDEFQHSGWFKRGWTLQELLAPRQLEFYARDWTFIGTRKSLCTDVSSATQIPLGLFYNSSEHQLHLYSIAQRMSWAASRETTRREDLAYCLLGIFNVNMPLLYGEGFQAAFKRLQLEILRTSNDESIFAWSRTPLEFDSLLAMEPKAFAADGLVTVGSPLASARSFTVSNQGLRIKMNIRPLSSDADVEVSKHGPSEGNVKFTEAPHFVSPLNCSRDDRPLCLLLRQGSEVLLRVGIRTLPVDTKLSEFSLKKLSLNVHKSNLYYRCTYSNAEGHSNNSIINLHLLSCELKSKMGQQVHCNVSPDGQQEIKAGMPRASSISSNRYDMLDFHMLFWSQNKLSFIFKSELGDGHLMSLVDFESGLLEFVRPRTWAESFLERLKYECALLQRQSLDASNEEI